jgi:hypothetical protein
MIVSLSVESFWESYFRLNPLAKRNAKKAYRLWSENPYHPSLRFKCINSAQNIWSVRISLGYRALCIMENGNAIWFWIGDHDHYERFFG